MTGKGPSYSNSPNGNAGPSEGAPSSPEQATAGYGDTVADSVSKYPH